MFMGLIKMFDEENKTNLKGSMEFLSVGKMTLLR